MNARNMIMIIARPVPKPAIGALKSAAPCRRRDLVMYPLVKWASLGLALLVACGERAGPDAHTQTPPASPERGLRLMAQYQCASCHEIPEVPGHRGGMGPSLEAFGRRSYIAGHIPNQFASLRQWLQDPQALVPGTPMPDLGVPDADATDMAAYLLSLK